MAALSLARRRARRIWDAVDALPGRAPDVVVLRNGTEPHVDLSFFYVSAIPSGIFEGSMALLLRDGSVHVVSSILEAESARKAKTGFRLHVPRSRDQVRKVLEKLVPAKAVVGFHGAELTVQDYRMLRRGLRGRRFRDVSKAVAKARMVKDAEEIRWIGRAARISSKVAQQIPDWLGQGVRESEVATKIDFGQQVEGGSGPSFDTIAAFGPNAAEPHYTALSSRLRKGQFALFDFGTRVQRYCSDITRTFFWGQPKAKDRAMYETVLAAQDAAFDAIAPGVRGDAVHNAAAEVIDKTEFRGTFIHGLGHGLGLAVHDGGGLYPASRMRLEPGMVLTVEPGVYLNGYGGVRIEDDIVVTKTGFRRLTTAPRGFEALS